LTATFQRLAELLASYEMDEAYTREFFEPNQAHFNVAWADVERWLAGEHSGDCVDMPSPCPRCYAEDIVHKAKWITERLLNPTI
jgi:hypothetical protein